MNKEKLQLTGEKARNIAWGDDKDFSGVMETITGTSRWSILYEKIVKRESDGKFFKMNYRVGATESQDERPYEDVEVANLHEVFAVEKTVTVYE